ncbi:hypothetical protein RhiJN_03901 [Ceratobasidium sp. AG-Ba]|nr:hypothetical protein RhiJN_03901 [Ceratobasidium sp. AG-Ba]QRW04794.1 hypothetical protein RhiLY_03793 [Ceratobasidium sp. AG-Ba]
MPPKSKAKPAITALQAQSKSKPTNKRSCGENEKTENKNGDDGGDIDGSGDGQDDQDMTGVEDQPRVFDQDGNQIPLDKLAELLKKPHGVSQPRNNKRRQVIKDDSDQEYRLTPVPKTPKRQNAKTPKRQNANDAL